MVNRNAKPLCLLGPDPTQRDNSEIFLHIDEMRYVVNRWRINFNRYRPHSGLRYMTSAKIKKFVEIL